MRLPDFGDRRHLQVVRQREDQDAVGARAGLEFELSAAVQAVVRVDACIDLVRTDAGRAQEQRCAARLRGSRRKRAPDIGQKLSLNASSRAHRHSFRRPLVVSYVERAQVHALDSRLEERPIALAQQVLEDAHGVVGIVKLGSQSVPSLRKSRRLLDVFEVGPSGSG